MQTTATYGVNTPTPPEPLACLKHFLNSALSVAEWLRAGYEVGDADAICFMDEWLTLKAAYAGLHPELSLSDAPLDDFSFIPLMRGALAALEHIETETALDAAVANLMNSNLDSVEGGGL